MVVGKVSEFIGSLYYLCVTLLRFKNIMKLKNYLLLLALLLVVGVRAQVPSGNKYPKREFRGHIGEGVCPCVPVRKRLHGSYWEAYNASASGRT